MEEKEATSFIPQVTQTYEQLFYYTSSCLYPNDTLMAPKLVLTYILWSTYAWNIHLKTNRRVRYNFLRYFIQFENHPEAKLMWRNQLSFPLNFFSPFLSFLALLSSFQACQVNCRTADFPVIEISWETRRKKKCCKNKATEGWWIQRDGSKKCGQMNVLPDTALASLREPCSHTTAVMNIPPCLAIPFLFFPCFSLLSLYPSSGCKLSLSTRNSLLSKLLFC